jgi:hypothetical protein
VRELAAAYDVDTEQLFERTRRRATAPCVWLRWSTSSSRTPGRPSTPHRRRCSAVSSSSRRPRIASGSRPSTRSTFGSGSATPPGSRSRGTRGCTADTSQRPGRERRFRPSRARLAPNGRRPA